MKCDRCQGMMCEERLVVRGGLVRIKNMKAWHCMYCGRTEYISTSSIDQDIEPCAKDYSDPAARKHQSRARPKRKEAGLS